MASSLSFVLIHLLLLAFSFLHLSTAVPSEAISDAADILADSSFVSMALTLEIVAESLLEQSPSATVFAPSDSAFKKSGQPSLVVTATPSDRITSLNNVRITGSPIYDDGFLLVYGIDRFFDPNFQDSNGSNQNPNSTPTCSARNLTASNSSDSFDQAIETLKSGGYSTMASFLRMQLAHVPDQSAITVFAPPDEMVLNRIGDFEEYPSFFLRHVAPCKLLWNDLVNFGDGTELPTFVEGFAINITRSGGVLNLNGVTVFFPDIFFNDKVVVHGVSDVLASQDSKSNRAVESLSHDDGDNNTTDEENVFDPGEF